MSASSDPVRTLHLDVDQMLILDDGHEGRVRVLHGGVWFTEEGEHADTFLQAGQEVAMSGRRAFVQARGAVDLQLTQGRAARPTLWQRWRERAARWQMGPVREAHC